MIVLGQSVTARWTFDGWHHWPDAPPRRAYLADKHRHLFHGTVTCTVHSGNREIEFHDLRDVAAAATPAGHDWNDWSCEAIAAAVAVAVTDKWQTTTTVTISEDGECDATVIADPS